MSMTEPRTGAVRGPATGPAPSEWDVPSTVFGDSDNPESGNQEHWSGRIPPQDVDAEQSVLGSMLISKDAIADVNEQVGGPDFYRPAHEMIYDAIVELYGRGDPADPVTVVAELHRRGQLQRVGGAPYLHTLTANVPIAANAGYYATIVREKA
ncbi:MAG: replicative DNA helicase, partial [Actinomycetota bacterium]|nr:replicative DNA helicase [Actinomycetota bacterium]